MTQTELCYLTIREAGRLLQSRQLSPVELTRAFLNRIEQLDAKLQSYITVLSDRAMSEARHAEAEILRSAARLYHDLTQILRLCVTGKFNPETSGENLLRVMARAGDTPDFSTLEARVRETQGEVRRVFAALVGGVAFA